MLKRSQWAVMSGRASEFTASNPWQDPETRLPSGEFSGTDVLKGLALGATAVMVARPPMWGLAAYGAEGVQTVVEILQTELARNMAASGRPTIAMIARDLVRFDSK